MTRLIRLLVSIVQRATGSLHPRAYPALVAAVESGVRWGWHRAHKHYGEVSADNVRRAVVVVMGTRHAEVEPIVAAVMAVLADRPSEDVICDAIAEAVLGEICERFEIPAEVDE